jgi:hypothetical protein
MTEDRITTVTSPDGRTTNTTFVSESAKGGGTGWLFGLIAIALIGGGAYYLVTQSGTPSKKDTAITTAATNVGKAAEQVGSAAQQVGDAAKDATDTSKK